jgi:hypothetical protein
MRYRYTGQIQRPVVLVEQLATEPVALFNLMPVDP